jgi:hypothetical protein
MRLPKALTFIVGIGIALCIPTYGGAAPLKAAAAKIDITPKNPVYLAGYGSNRKNNRVHDPVWARCLVLESGEARIAFVACDLIGFPRFVSEKVRKRVKNIRPERLYISATHTHSGPDTLGQWGPDIQTSGVDKVWWEETQERIVQLIESTALKLQPATLKFASTQKTPKVSKNVRVPSILDTELGAMQVLNGTGEKVIATFVNFACHPEVLNSHVLSSDFPNWLYSTVESKVGGVCLYLNGAQGGMITADFDESVLPKGENFRAAEEIGTKLALRTLEILEGATLLKEAPIHTQRSVFSVPMENPRFKMLIKLKIFPNDLLTNGNIETEVNRVTIGDAEFLTLPGEVLPNIGFMLKRNMTGKTKFLLGLTCDELGYILCEEDFDLKLYEYESSVSVGERMGVLMIQNLKKLLAEGKK